MNDQRLEAMLDGHAWPDMPVDAHERLRGRVAAYGRTARSRRLSIAAALLLTLLIGGAGGYILAPRGTAPQPQHTHSATDDVASAPNRLVIRASVFSESRPTLVRRTDPGAWGAITTN
ncbi:MAG: hypothetical protein Tsb0013_12040 [Phycisphaerales bacterium]